MSTTTVQIIRSDNKEFVDAELHTDVSASVLAETEKEWGPIRIDLTRKLVTGGHPQADIPRHWHWDWGAKSQNLAFLAYKCFGLRCEGKMQGLMMVKVAGRNATLAPDAGKPLVYIDYLESAPWNVVPLVPKPRFSGIGVVLMRVAVQLSNDEGFHGRIGLHALPQSESFYRDKCGMQGCGADPHYQNLPYYEMTRQQGTKIHINLKGRDEVMELKIQRDWLARMAEQEANGIVSVGGLVTLAEQASKEHNVGATERSALSQLVQWQRRKLRLTIDTLAKKADIDLEEVLMIENGTGSPEARTIFKLSDALKLPPNKLMTLAGLVKARDLNVEHAAVRFAACSAPVEALTAEETKALEEFVRALGE